MTSPSSAMSDPISKPPSKNLKWEERSEKGYTHCTTVTRICSGRNCESLGVCTVPAKTYLTKSGTITWRCGRCDICAHNRSKCNYTNVTPESLDLYASGKLDCLELAEEGKEAGRKKRRYGQKGQPTMLIDDVSNTSLSAPIGRLSLPEPTHSGHQKTSDISLANQTPSQPRDTSYELEHITMGKIAREIHDPLETRDEANNPDYLNSQQAEDPFHSETSPNTDQVFPSDCLRITVNPDAVLYSNTQMPRTAFDLYDVSHNFPERNITGGLAMQPTTMDATINPQLIYKGDP